MRGQVMGAAASRFKSSFVAAGTAGAQAIRQAAPGTLGYQRVHGKGCVWHTRAECSSLTLHGGSTLSDPMA